MILFVVFIYDVVVLEVLFIVFDNVFICFGMIIMEEKMGMMVFIDVDIYESFIKFGNY